MNPNKFIDSGPVAHVITDIHSFLELLFDKSEIPDYSTHDNAQEKQINKRLRRKLKKIKQIDIYHDYDNNRIIIYTKSEKSSQTLMKFFSKEGTIGRNGVIEIQRYRIDSIPNQPSFQPFLMESQKKSLLC